MQILNAREPIARVLADPATPAELKQRLETVRAAREFASARARRCLTTRATPRYADLKREYVVWSVVATPEFSVEPREWCFPIVGCVAYRGYFKRSEGRGVRRAAAREGFDAMVGGVPAYSTLGKFNDPILNTMMGYGDDELASIMFHELSHQVVYIPDDTSFNEAFAVTVEQEGLARWLTSRGRARRSRQRHLKRRERQAEGMRVVARYRERARGALRAATSRPRRCAQRKARGFCARWWPNSRRWTARYGVEVGAGRRTRRRAQQRAPRVARHLLRLRARIRAACSPNSSTTCRGSTPR